MLLGMCALSLAPCCLAVCVLQYAMQCTVPELLWFQGEIDGLSPSRSDCRWRLIDVERGEQWRKREGLRRNMQEEEQLWFRLFLFSFRQWGYFLLCFSGTELITSHS